MATADELLSEELEVVEEIITTDWNTRVLAIPASITNLGVESDDNVKHLQFKIPRHCGTIDLSEFIISVNFEDANGNGDVYPVKDVTVTEDRLSFIWDVDRTAFGVAGNVKFNLCLTRYEDEIVVQELNTTPAKLPVLPGLETGENLVERNPTLFDTLIARLYAIEAATGLGQNGYYSVVKVEESEDGAVFTILNQDGLTEAIVRHGKTPVNGVDYWTEEEKTELKSELKAAITADAVHQTKAYVDSRAPFNTTITIPRTSWRPSGEYTLALPGITVNCMVDVSPEPGYDNSLEYARCKVRCVNQYADTLVFNCRGIPSIDLEVNLAIFYTTKSNTVPVGLNVVDDGEGNVTIV